MSIRYTSDQLQRKFPGPAGSPGFARLADGLRSEGRFDEAISVCQEGLRRHPVLSGYVVLGKALMDANRLDEAREQFEAALRLDPRCLSAMHMLASIMNKLQWADAAAGYFRSILEVEPWDAEIRALLGEIASPGFPAQTSGPSETQYAPFAPEEETFEKPAGFDGDVLEVNLNEMASDFLPAGDTTGMAETSLEDALAPADVFVPQDGMPAESALEAAPDSAPPISGQDVEDRIDSLFGSEDSAPSSGTATWTAARAPETPLDASASATGEMRTGKTGEIPALDTATQFAPLPAPENPEERDPETGLQDYRTVDQIPQTEESVPDAAVPGETDRVDGEDIERRLDELFNLPAEDERPFVESPARALSASDLPVAPGPRMDEAVSLGESVTFGEVLSPANDPDDTAEARASSFTLAAATSAAPFEMVDFAADTAASETLFAPAASEPSLGITDASSDSDGEIVTGQDVVDKLDTIFGIEGSGPKSALPAPEADVVFSEPKPWAQDNEIPPAPPTGELMSTESMLPPGWFGDAGDGPRVTGADVEAQLDKLFNLESAPDAPSPGEALGNTENTVAFVAPEARAAQTGEDDDRTMLMPAVKEQSSTDSSNADGRLRESVADWLSRQEEIGDSAPGAAPEIDPGDTLILPAGDLTDEPPMDFDATLELPSTPTTVADEMEAFGTLAPEELADFSETTAIEMVDGGDVAERLDRLFAEPGSAGVQADPDAIPEMPLFAQNDILTDTTDSMEPSDEASDPAGTLLVPVSGEDVASRLHNIFDGENGEAAGTQSTPTDLTHDSETDVELPPTPIAGASGDPESRPAPEFAPLLDEEEGYPEDEEMPASGGASANVATVTLAEIYFQQGLKEQALQIYRQLLEREPENDTVRKRIGEIEATKPEGGDREPGSDPRRPRPGLKVPKRKK